MAARHRGQSWWHLVEIVDLFATRGTRYLWKVVSWSHLRVVVVGRTPSPSMLEPLLVPIGDPLPRHPVGARAQPFLQVSVHLFARTS